MRGRFLVWAALALAVTVGCRQTDDSPSRQVPPELKQYVLDSVPADVEHRSLIDFEGKVHLVGYEVEATEPVSPGGRVTLTMYWKPVAPLGPGWSLFTHVVDERRRQVERPAGEGFDDVGPLRRRVQEDGPQALPPSQWVVGKVYQDVQALQLPGDLTATEVTVLVGIGQDFRVPEPASTPASADESEAEESEQTETSEAEGDAQQPGSRHMRLRILTGPADRENRAVLAHLKLRPRPASAPAPKERRARRKVKRARSRRGKPDRVPELKRVPPVRLRKERAPRPEQP